MIGNPKPKKKTKKSKAIPKKIVKAVFERDGNVCQKCGCFTAGLNNSMLPSTHCHHVIKKSQGGKDTVDNLITVCWSCHTKEHN